MQEDKTLIEVTGLVKKYGNHVAVDHLSFRLEPGKIYGFLGPNGAGKSTTMNMMTGYIGPTEGTILINGHDIVKEPADFCRGIGSAPGRRPAPTRRRPRSRRSVWQQSRCSGN